MMAGSENFMISRILTEDLVFNLQKSLPKISHKSSQLERQKKMKSVLEEMSFKI